VVKAPKRSLKALASARFAARVALSAVDVEVGTTVSMVGTAVLGVPVGVIVEDPVPDGDDEDGDDEDGNGEDGDDDDGDDEDGDDDDGDDDDEDDEPVDSSGRVPAAVSFSGASWVDDEDDEDDEAELSEAAASVEGGSGNPVTVAKTVLVSRLLDDGEEASLLLLLAEEPSPAEVVSSAASLFKPALLELAFALAFGIVSDVADAALPSLDGDGEGTAFSERVMTYVIWLLDSVAPLLELDFASSLLLLLAATVTS